MLREREADVRPYVRCQSTSRSGEDRKHEEAHLIERAQAPIGLHGLRAADQVHLPALARVPNALEQTSRIVVDDDVVR